MFGVIGQEGDRKGFELRVARDAGRENDLWTAAAMASGVPWSGRTSRYGQFATQFEES